MQYRVIQCVSGYFHVTETTDVIAWAEAAGVEIKEHRMPINLRAELVNQPVLANFCGPIWDDGVILYQDESASAILSS